MRLIHIGFGNMVSAERLLAIVGPDSSPIRRVIQESRERGELIDASYGRRTRSVLMMDSGHVVLSALPPETVAARFDQGNEPAEARQEAVNHEEA